MKLKPDFYDNPYFDSEKWELKKGAPKELVEEFEKYMQEEKELEEQYPDYDY